MCHLLPLCYITLGPHCNSTRGGDEEPETNNPPPPTPPPPPPPPPHLLLARQLCERKEKVGKSHLPPRAPMNAAFVRKMPEVFGYFGCFKIKIMKFFS